MLNPWDLGVESAQLVVRLTGAWGLGIYDRAAPHSKKPSWKLVTVRDMSEHHPAAPKAEAKKHSVKARVISRRAAVSYPKAKARPVIMRAAASHPKAKAVRRSGHKSR
jgi:hypothetical protein